MLIYEVLVKDWVSLSNDKNFHEVRSSSNLKHDAPNFKKPEI